jgi:hypothetical protein
LAGLFLGWLFFHSSSMEKRPATEHQNHKNSDMDMFHAPSDQTEPSWEMPDLRNGSDSAEDGPLIGDEHGPGCGSDEQ